MWEMLKNWRGPLPPGLAWGDGDEPSRDINGARLRGKYYGAAYIITRPFLHNALYEMDHEGVEIDLSRFDTSPEDHATPEHSSEPDIPLPKLDAELDGASRRNQIDRILWACKKCVDAAMKSTTAFDGLPPINSKEMVPRRPRVTNIHGTAAA
jgi:hypothetical protein